MIGLIQNDFCDINKSSTAITSSTTSLNHVASISGGKHIEDRIFRKTEKTLKTEAAELKHYFDTVYIAYMIGYIYRFILMVILQYEI